MREILFRGKRDKRYCAEQEWTYGVPFIDHEGDCIFKTRSSEYVVDPETVGWYTGLTDKNGKKIFEGDILAFSDRLVHVHWHDYCGCWDCSYIKAIEGKATLHEDRGPHKWRYNAEVIGNIHDNPELLEEDV